MLYQPYAFMTSAIYIFNKYEVIPTIPRKPRFHTTQYESQSYLRGLS
jgi:hypothetical protein